MAFNKSLKALTWFITASIAVAACVYLVLLAVNWRDRPASEAAIQLEKLYRDRNPVADEDNAFVYMMGFSVARQENPRAFGVERIARAHRFVDQPDNEDAFLDHFGVGDHDFTIVRSASVTALSEMCSEADETCLEVLEDGDLTIEEWLTVEEWVLSRYRALLAHPAWLETAPLDMRIPFPPYHTVLEGQKLLLAQSWVSAGRGDVADVRRLLQEDMQFWREILASSDILITKMIAVAALKRHFTWSNLILRKLPAGQTMDGMPQGWLTPISQSERSMSRVLTGEWVFSSNYLRQLKARGPNPLTAWEEEETAVQSVIWRMLKPMLQLQDSSNRYAELMTSLAETLQVPYEQYPEAMERARSNWDQAVDTPYLSRTYNPVADVLFYIGDSDFPPYAARLADLEGLRRIAVLASELRSQNVQPEDVADKLANVAARNPYNGQPFLWAESAGTIVFDGLEEGERGRHEVIY